MARFELFIAGFENPITVDADEIVETTDRRGYEFRQTGEGAVFLLPEKGHLVALKRTGDVVALPDLGF